MSSPAFTIVLNHAGSLARMLLPPSQLSLAEAYVRGDFEVEGNMEAAAGLAIQLRNRLASPVSATRLMVRLRRLPRPPRRRWRAGLARRGRLGPRHSLRRDAAAVRYHYDLGNDFYALWLDRQMVYSCAYFPTGEEDIDTAQVIKLEYACRKLRLRPGERLLDIGCGWGALIRHAVEHHGVQALGITLSEAQARHANAASAEQGLGDRCAVEVRDYRDLHPKPAFDKIVSIGMVEHVGREQLKPYFSSVFRLLHPGGLFLNHGITWVAEPEPAGLSRLLPRWGWREGTFMDRYVFPDGDLVSLEMVIAAAEASGFDTRDVENLREHYAMTLRHWIRRLEGSADAITDLVGEGTYRTWRLYMSGCASRFTSGRMALDQVLLAKPNSGGQVSLPLTRADLYAGNLRG
ncbi:MAG TPA: cyclopropane-fatty-acyl-phospholipid synthase family protein [Gemmatimonadales bacterium]|nr:cyclopropane-fatty-acyl-phospholipid synthase family protein [Gemmatimonadales bacterium]